MKTSRVSRDPSGLGTSECPVREGDQSAALQYSSGGDVPNGLEDAATHRIPEVESDDPSFNVSTGSTGREHQEDLRRSEGGILPVRQEPESIGIEEYARGHGEMGQSGPGGNRSSGRRSSSEKDGFQAFEGSTGSSQSSDEGESGSDERAGSVPKGQTKASCFLDKERGCNRSCKAYTETYKEPCKFLRLIDKIINPNSIVFAQPPKVGK
jgi:hypothetical protein